MIRVILLSALFGQSLAYSQAKDEAVAKSFNGIKIVPDVIATAPEKYVEVYYPAGSIVDLGNELEVPSVVVQPTEVVWEAEEDTCYTLAFVDPDAPSPNTPTSRNLKHWLVGNIERNDVMGGTMLATYLSPAPGFGTGLHRYVYIIFEQPRCNISFDENNLEGEFDRDNFDVNMFANKYGLVVYAGNFFVAES